MADFEFLRHELEALETSDMLRKLRCVESGDGTCLRIDGEEKVIFCSNDYLNLSNEPRVVKAAKEAAGRTGIGSGASRLISGTHREHVELEAAFAEFFHTESALLFSSGWNANEAVIKTLPKKGNIVLLDKFDHASIIDAVRASGVAFRTYRRNETAGLEKHLADKKYNRKYIITESVFSMDGDRADLKTLVELKKTYDAYLVVDEAHAVGCMGKTGAGLAEELGLLDEIDIIVAPLGKAVGVSGAIAAGKKVVTDYLINKARAFIYTTAPSPVIAASAKAALEIILNEPQRRVHLKENADYLRKRLKGAGCNVLNSTTHIIPVVIGGAKETLFVSNALFERGFFVAAIRPPTVAKDSSRLRISVQANHTKEQIDGLVDALNDVMRLIAD